MSPNKRHRSYTFTVWKVGQYDINSQNIEDAQDQLMLLMSVDGTRYVCTGREIGEQGGHHLQGYISFDNARVRPKYKDFPSIHFIVSDGTGLENRTYCSKDGLFVEWPNLEACPADPKAQGPKGAEAWDSALAAARRGDLDSIPAKMYVSHYNTWQKIRSLEGVKPSDMDGLLLHEWHWGVAGTGKSSTVRKNYPDAFIKNKTKWWDGYKGERTIIIDDWSPFTVGITDLLKEWSDRYAFQAEVKQGGMLIRPLRIIVTSQYTIDEIWQDRETRDAIRRRFPNVFHHNGIMGQHILVTAPIVPDVVPPAGDVFAGLLLARDIEELDDVPVTNLSPWRFGMD